MQIIDPCRRGAAILAVGLLVLGITPVAQAADSICATAAETIQKTPAASRMAVLRKWLAADCEDVPATLWTAIESGKWSDGGVIIGPDRAALLQGLAENKNPQAIKLVIATLEVGAWPNQDPLQPALGASLIESVHGSHDRYSTLLLLDIYDQIENIQVRASVIHSLTHCEVPEARLPALDSYWKADPVLKEAAEIALAGWSKDSADAQLKWTIGALKKGPALKWALRIQKNSR